MVRRETSGAKSVFHRCTYPSSTASDGAAPLLPPAPPFPLLFLWCETPHNNIDNDNDRAVLVTRVPKNVRAPSLRHTGRHTHQTLDHSLRAPSVRATQGTV